MRHLVILSLAWASLFALGCAGAGSTGAQDSEGDSTSASASSKRTGRFPKGRSSRSGGSAGGGSGVGKFVPPDQSDCGRTGIGGGPLYYCPGDEEVQPADEESVVRKRSSYRLPDLSAGERTGS
jgi:hypothetical protein